jgi:hypothetical protein
MNSGTISSFTCFKYIICSQIFTAQTRIINFFVRYSNHYKFTFSKKISGLNRCAINQCPDEKQHHGHLGKEHHEKTDTF